jgi:DinB superfamily
MKIAFRVVFCVLLTLTGQAALAQTKLTISQALDFWITTTENEVVPAADAMPEEKYSFAPTRGEFTGVRTFAQQVKHLAANNYRMAAYILAQTPTAEQESEIGPAAVQSKVQIVDYVKGSFGALHRAMAAINDANLLETLPAFPSSRQKTRLQLAEDVVAHSYDHYGQMVEYLRMNGIVPPASRR